MVYRKAALGRPKHKNPWVNMTLSLSSILNSSVLFSAQEGLQNIFTVSFGFLHTGYKTYLQPAAVTELARVVTIGAHKHYCMHFTETMVFAMML